MCWVRVGQLVYIHEIISDHVKRAKRRDKLNCCVFLFSVVLTPGGASTYALCVRCRRRHVRGKYYQIMKKKVVRPEQAVLFTELVVSHCLYLLILGDRIKKNVPVRC